MSLLLYFCNINDIFILYYNKNIIPIKVLAFKGTAQVRTKIKIHNQILVPVNTFNYLGGNISWATGWTIGVLGFDSRRGLGIFLLTTASRTALRSTQPPIQWVPGALALGVKRPGREADHSPPSSAEVKE
jgi:hypothetical protein